MFLSVAGKLLSMEGAVKELLRTVLLLCQKRFVGRGICNENLCKPILFYESICTWASCAYVAQCIRQQLGKSHVIGASGPSMQSKQYLQEQGETKGLQGQTVKLEDPTI